MTHWKPIVIQEVEKTTPLQKLLLWAKRKQEILAVAFLLILLLSVGIPYYLRNQRQSEKDGLQKLNVAQYYLTSSVDEKNGPFKTEREKYQAALQQFQQIASQNAGTWAAKASRYYEAKCQMVMGQYSQAYLGFDEASQRLKGTSLGEASILGKGTALGMQEKWAAAAGVYEQYLTQYPEGFLVDEIRLHLADTYLKTGEKQKAVEQWKKIVARNPKGTNGLEAVRLIGLNKS